MRATFWLLHVLLLQLVKFTCSGVQDEGSHSIGNSTKNAFTSSINHRKTSCDCKLINWQKQLCEGTGCVQIPPIVSSNVTRVRIEGTNITELRVDDFDGYGNVVDMKLDRNKINFIENDTFRTLKHLVNLSISFNPLKQLEAGCFTGLESLELLQLTNNKFKFFSRLVPSLTLLHNLKTLKLDNNLFDRLNDDDFIQLSNSSIKVLSLENCALEQIHPNALKPLKALTDLNLSKNKISGPDLIALMRNLKESNLTKVDVSDLGCISLEDTLPRLMKVLSHSNVSHLILQKNNVPQLGSTSFEKMPHLCHLDLSHCSIQSIENDTFDSLINLTSLNLSQNSINGVPPAVLSLSKLERFDFSSNCGSSSESGILELSNNMFSQMTALHYLDLSYNRLQMSSNSFHGLGNLQVNNRNVFRSCTYTLRESVRKIDKIKKKICTPLLLRLTMRLTCSVFITGIVFKQPLQGNFSYGRQLFSAAFSFTNSPFKWK